MPTNGRRPVEILSRQEVAALYRACSARAPTGIRNRALIIVLWRGGLRAEEALALYPRDLDTDSGTLNVRHGKGDRQRLVGIEPDAFEAIKLWLDKRTQLGFKGRQPVFCTLKGRPINPQYLRELFPRLAHKAAIDKRVHAHALRHTHASELVREGVDVAAIQAQLGHASLVMTQRYIAKIAPQERVTRMRLRAFTLD